MIQPAVPDGSLALLALSRNPVILSQGEDDIDQLILGRFVQLVGMST